MNDYSDLIYLMGAMVLFSLLTMNVTRSMVLNNTNLSDNELDYEAIAVAHSHIDKLQWITNEEGFTTTIDDDYPKKEDIETAKGNVSYYVYVKKEIITVPGSDVTNYKVTVGIENKFLNENFDATNLSGFNNSDHPVKLEFMKSFKN